LRSDPARNQNCNQLFSVCCAWFQKKPKPNKTVKLTLNHRTCVLRALIYRRWSIEMNQTAHISLQLSNNVKEQTSKTQKQTVAQILQRHRLHPTKNASVSPERLNRLSGPSSPVVPASPRWLSVPSGVSQ